MINIQINTKGGRTLSLESYISLVNSIMQTEMIMALSGGPHACMRSFINIYRRYNPNDDIIIAGQVELAIYNAVTEFFKP